MQFSENIFIQILDTLKKARLGFSVDDKTLKDIAEQDLKKENKENNDIKNDKNDN